ncbi:MAG: acyl carrier protein [Clostridia bacterium]|nr:acyl carrier protein [Clostridia bacterium]MDD4048989.1 acyl carrier protein [Clostridia bacterium]
MKELFDDLKKMVDEFGTAPTIEEMPKRSLSDKGINGPTAAHVIEEVHSPLNLAYLTFTTGSSAFQNIVGITYAEMDNRIKATHKALKNAGVKKGDKVLFAYPPLVNVFSQKALESYGLEWSFLCRSSRDAFISEFYEKKPDVIVGESSFLRASLEDAKMMDLVQYLPKGKVLITAGTPLDLELLPVAEETINSKVHDLYGCQEFGWLMLDGVLLRDDISMLKLSTSKDTHYEVVVGGLPMGDSFVYAESGHVCNKEGKIITYRRKRTYPEYEVVVKETTLSSQDTISRVARTILRIKGRIIKVDPDVKVSATHTILELRPGIGTYNKDDCFVIEGPEKTKLFDDMVKAQLDYQQNSKKDPTWIK